MKKTSIPGYGRLAAFLFALPLAALAAWTANEDLYLPNGTYGGDTEFSASGDFCQGATFLEQYNWDGDASCWWAVYRFGHPILWEYASGPRVSYVYADVSTNDPNAYWAECSANLIDATGSVLADKR